MDTAALEEANRLRASMGMAPLPIPGQAAAARSSDDEADPEDALATLDGRQAAAYDNYQKLQDAEEAKRKRKQRSEAVKAAREKAQRHALLRGKTLADLDFDGEQDDATDAKSWLRNQKKRQKKISKAEQQRLDEEDEARRRQRRKAGLDSDGEGGSSAPAGLRVGLRVGHDVDALLDGDEQILTLKDAGVLDDSEDGDELENQELRERERLDARLLAKKRRQAYNPLDDDDDGGERTVLAQYDEEIYGKKKKHFTLDPNAILGLSGGQAKAVGVTGGLGLSSAPVQAPKGTEMDDLVGDGPSADYLDLSEIKMKKPKKKKGKRATRQRGDGDDEGLFPAGGEDGGDDDGGAGDGGDGDAAMDVDDGAGAAAAAARRRKRRALDDDDLLRDDDELQLALTSQRRDAFKKRKRLRPEDLAKQLLEDQAAAEAEAEAESSKAGGLVIDETAEFISNLRRRDDEEARPKKRAAGVTATAGVTTTTTEEPVTTLDKDDVAMKDESDDDDEGKRLERAGSQGVAGLEEEKLVSKGMGSVLSLLKDRGIIEADVGASSAERNEQLRRSRQFVADKRVLLARLDEEARRERERDRTSGHLSQMKGRDREEYARQKNQSRETKTARLMQRMYEESYTPSFNLEYTDEHGRQLNEKEAFRELSHGFHGKTSGRGKTDKQLKKIEAEKRRMAEGILDASQNVGMSSATAQQTKKRKEAGVRLD